MNRQDFIDSKANPVTKAFFSTINSKIRGLEQELGYQAGESLRNDAIKVGAIQNCRDILDTDWEEVSND